MRRILPPLLLLGLLALLAAGCGDEAVPTGADLTGSDDFATLDFDQQFGGLTATDEPAAFGDPDLEAILAAADDGAVDDPLADSADVRALVDLGRLASTLPDSLRPRFTFVRLRWGMLRTPADTLEIMPPCPSTDWTGAVYTDYGIVLVRRLIAFERPADHVIWPRLDRQTVGLVSHTSCRYDGLVLQIIERGYEADPAATPVRNRLHIELGPYEAVFNVDELRDLHEVAEVDDLGNRFEIAGFTLGDIAVCPKGFLSGTWRATPPPAVAVSPDTTRGTRLGGFAGAWFTLDGRLHGFLRGGYGLDPEGNRIFLGKYIGPRGAFRGFLRGTWDAGAVDHALAGFVGHWYDARGRAEGLLGGQAHQVGNQPRGIFAGRWTTLCDPEAEDAVH